MRFNWKKYLLGGAVCFTTLFCATLSVSANPNTELAFKIGHAASAMDSYLSHSLSSFLPEDLAEVFDYGLKAYENPKLIEEIGHGASGKRDVIVVGDTHGDVNSFKLCVSSFFDKLSTDNDVAILFLGDYIDKGENSIGCLSAAFFLKHMFPDNVFLLRGNHEYMFSNSQDPQIGNSLASEIRSIYRNSGHELSLNHSRYANFLNNMLRENPEKINFSFFPKYTEFLSKLPLEKLDNANLALLAYRIFLNNLPVAAIVNDNVFCVHGGLSPLLGNINDLNPENPNANKIIYNLLWSDPNPKIQDKSVKDVNDLLFSDKNSRGKTTLYYGLKAFYLFMKHNNFTTMIRGHQQPNQYTPGSICNQLYSCDNARVLEYQGYIDHNIPQDLNLNLYTVSSLSSYEFGKIPETNQRFENIYNGAIACIDRNNKIDFSQFNATFMDVSDEYSSD